MWCIVFPILCIYAVSFENLYGLRAPVGTVEGFDISAFDRRVRNMNMYSTYCINLFPLLFTDALLAVSVSCTFTFSNLL